MNLILLTISVILGASGQLFFKKASDSISKGEAIMQFYIQILQSPFLWAGLFCYGISAVIWFKILAHFELSFARSFVGVGYIITAIFAVVFLNEKITMIRWIAIFLITSGVILLTLTK